MNIFVTSLCPIQSAKNLDDKRVNKMLLESCQMLSTAARAFPNSDVDYNALYRPSYIHHPCTVWTAKSIENFTWLYRHAATLSTLFYTINKKTHSCDRILNIVSPLVDYGVDVPEDFCDCTEYKENPWVITRKYQRFMILKWATRDVVQPRWTNRRIPSWYVNHLMRQKGTSNA